MNRILGSAFSILTIVLVACGGSGSGGSTGDGSASVSGTVGGQAVPTTGTAAISITESSDGGISYTADAVIISNAPGECARAQARSAMPGLTGLLLVVGGLGNSIPTGTYPIGGLTADGHEAMASFTVDDASCNAKSSDRATGGSITLTTSDASDLAGSFDVAFPNGDHLTGTFSTPLCPVQYSPDAGPASCG